MTDQPTLSPLTKAHILISSLQQQLDRMTDSRDYWKAQAQRNNT